MVKLVTKASGVAALLFHVEHSEKSEWFYRWRIIGPYPERYLSWREFSSKDSRVVIRPDVACCGVEAEWRADADSSWEAVGNVVSEIGDASFSLTAKENFFAPKGFRAMAVLPGELVACYFFPPVEVSGGQTVVIPGRADGPYPDNILLSGGEFRYEDSLCIIANQGASASGYRDDPESNSVLSVIPGIQNRRVFARQAPVTNLHPSQNHG